MNSNIVILTFANLKIIKIAGTIVTYEVVLIQFNSVTNEVIDKNSTINCP